MSVLDTALFIFNGAVFFCVTLCAFWYLGYMAITLYRILYMMSTMAAEPYVRCHLTGKIRKLHEIEEESFIRNLQALRRIERENRRAAGQAPKRYGDSSYSGRCLK